MNGLLKKQVLRFTEHPVTKLVCRELAQWYVVDGFGKPRLSQSMSSQSPQQFAKRGMEYEILIYADWNAVEPAFRNQSAGFIGADRQGLFDQCWYAGLKEWEGGFCMQIWRRQYVYGIDFAC